jgi:hypothetical protein
MASSSAIKQLSSCGGLAIRKYNPFLKLCLRSVRWGSNFGVEFLFCLFKDVSRSVQCPVVRWLMNGDLEGMWKESVAVFKGQPSHVRRCPGRDETGVSATELKPVNAM